MSDIEIRYLDHDVVKGTSVIPLFNPTGKADRQRHLAVSLVLRTRVSDAEAVELNFHRLAETFVPLLRTQRVDAIAGADDLPSLATWLVARLRNRGIGAARLERLELIDDSGPSFTLASDFHVIVNGSNGHKEDFVSLLQSCELVGHFTSAERYNTRADSECIRQMLSDAASISIPVACFLCPPYVGEPVVTGGTRYIGVHDSFEDEPATYNFDYHYRLYIDCLSAIARLANSRNVSITPIVVFSDWALIGIEEIRKTMGNDDRIVATLAKFREGMSRYAKDLVPGVEVTSFQELGVADHFPLGLPASGAAREAWLRTIAQTDTAITQLLTDLLAYAMSPEKLRDLLDWRAFRTIEKSPHRSKVIDCLKVYHNICRLRFAALSPEEQLRVGDIKADSANGLHYEAYMDAVLRLVQYQLYAKLFVKRFGDAICCYQDPGFTACGNLFRLPSFPVVFLDPTRVLAAR